MILSVFFFQAKDGIRDEGRSQEAWISSRFARGLGDRASAGVEDADHVIALRVEGRKGHGRAVSTRPGTDPLQAGVHRLYLSGPLPHQSSARGPRIEPRPPAPPPSLRPLP